MPSTPTSATIKEHNAIAALIDLKNKGHADLAQKFVEDFLAAGFKVNGKVLNDLSAIDHVDPGAASVLQTMATDPAAVALFFLDGTGLQQVGDAIGGIAGSIAQTPGKTLPGVGSGLNSAANDLTGGATSVAGLISALTQRSTWVRVAEGLVGIVLLAIGVMALTKDTTVYKQASKYAAKGVKYLA